MTEFWNENAQLLLQGTWETLYMTFVSTFFAYLLGLPLGVLLTITKRGNISSAPRFNAGFGWVMNILRSLPFMILMVFLLPFTRLLAGTSIGAKAAVVPLVIAAAPFIARMVETSLEEVDSGVVEAARCMGATKLQIVTKVMLWESIPSLMRGLSIITITILGYTAITGAMGAGGLGEIAYRYGFQRYQKDIMYVTIVLLIIIVFIIQEFFNFLANRLDKRNR